MGVYENALEKINHFWKETKESIFYLAPLGIGILLAVLLGSGVILHFLTKYYLFTIALFIGLILGTVPDLVQKEKLSNFDFVLIFMIVWFFFYIEKNFSFPEFIPDKTIFSYVYIFILGIIDAFTTVVPGISGTATFMMLGCYSFILNLFSHPLAYFSFSCFFVFGLFIGVISIVKLVSYLFLHHRHGLWIWILGFLFSSILSLLMKIIDLVNQSNLFGVLLLFFLGILFINLFRKE